MPAETSLPAGTGLAIGVLLRYGWVRRALASASVHLGDALLDLLARLPRLLLNTVDDVVGIVACLVHVLLRQLTEFVNELLLQLRRALTDLLFEHVVRPIP